MTKAVGWYLENQNGNHDKFYAVVLLEEEGIVVLNWGRRGTYGQHSVKEVGPGQAKAIALRQAYAKRSEGYEMLDEDFEFEYSYRDFGEWEASCQEFLRERRKPRYDRSREMVVKHYDEFVDKAQQLMSSVGEREFENLMAELEALETAWAAIQDHHAQADVTISLTKQMLHQRLMSGVEA